MKRSMLLIAMLMIGVFTSHAQTDTDTCYARGGYLDETDTCILEGGFSLYFEYPTEFVGYDIAQNIIDTFFELQREYFTDFYIETLSMDDDLPMRPWYLEITYDLYPYSEAGELVTVVFSIYEYTGGAHDNFYYETITFDLIEDTDVPLEWLFVEGSDPIAVVYPLVVEQLNAQLSEFGLDETWLEPSPEYFQDFIITEDSITFLFEPYVAAPYAAGPLQVEIPMSELADISALPFYTP